MKGIVSIGKEYGEKNYLKNNLIVSGGPDAG